jgi:hypothetical protein
MKNSKKTTYVKSNHSHLPRAAGGPSSLPRTPRTFGGCPRPPVLLAAVVGFVAWARMVVVAWPDAVSVVVVEESVASEEAVAPPPVSSPAVGVAAEVVELHSAPPPPPSFGAWAPAPRPRSRRHAGASGTCSLRLGCSVRVPPPGPHRPFASRQHPHCPYAGAPAPAPSPSLSRGEPDLRVLAPRDLRWYAAGGPEWCRGSGARDWGRFPATGPPGRPRPGSASSPGLMTAAPGPRTGP